MSTHVRPAAALLTALCGAAIGVGALLSWVAAQGRRPASGMTHTSITGLFHWAYHNSSPFLRSFSAVVVLIGVLVVIAGLVGWRLLTGLLSLVALAAAGLWLGLNTSHYHLASLQYSDLRVGAWLTVGGGLVGLITAFFLRTSRA
ncbi:MAG TPA: hypothetical protein VGH27_07460 [Streptosporangiaceae bacterium]